MQIDIDYFGWPEKFTYMVEFNNAIFESLEPSREDLFIRRMNEAFPGFSGKVIPNMLGYPTGCVIVYRGILDNCTLDKLTERAEAFSYSTTDHADKNVIIFKPNNAPSGLPLESRYIHLSPVDSLDSTGIRCKSSGKFETYEPRIYLFPLSSLVDPHSPPDKMYAGLEKECTKIARLFNDTYLKKKVIEQREIYYMYLVDLPTAFQRYDDFSFDRLSVYILNNITPDKVAKIGVLENS